MSTDHTEGGTGQTPSSQLVRAMLSSTTETLRLISAHPGDLTAVLHGILAKAAELCGGEAGSITLLEGESGRFVASHGAAMMPYVGTTIPAAAVDPSLFARSPAGALHVDDFAAATKGTPYLEQVATVGRVRSYAAVELSHEGAPIGALHMYRRHHPQATTLVSPINLSTQRGSASSLAGRKIYDKLKLLQPLVGTVRAVRDEAWRRGVLK